jgi:hypothetical protein
MNMIVYISAGNSDNKLSQYQWSRLLGEIGKLVRGWPWARQTQGALPQLHGEWFSHPQSQFQNACWCIETDNDAWIGYAKGYLGGLANVYGQESITWAVVANTDFLTASVMMPVSTESLLHVGELPIEQQARQAVNDAAPDPAQPSGHHSPAAGMAHDPGNITPDPDRGTASDHGYREPGPEEPELLP